MDAGLTGPAPPLPFPSESHRGRAGAGQVACGMVVGIGFGGTIVAGYAAIGRVSWAG